MFQWMFQSSKNHRVFRCSAILEKKILNCKSLYVSNSTVVEPLTAVPILLHDTSEL